MRTREQFLKKHLDLPVDLYKGSGNFASRINTILNHPMSSLDISRFLKSMKRKEETPLSFKSLNAQINAMMLAICLVEDKDSRIQFMKRIEVCVATYKSSIPQFTNSTSPRYFYQKNN